MDIEALLREISGGVQSLTKESSEHRTAMQGVVERMGKLENRVGEIETKTKTRSASVPGCNEGKDKGRFSFARAFLAISEKNEKLAPFECEVMREGAKAKYAGQRALSSDVDSAGGYVVPDQYMAELIELLRARTVIDKVGASRLSGLSGGSAMIPKQTGGATSYWVAEAGTITESQQTVGLVEVKPRELAGLVKASARLLRLSNPGVEQMVREDLARVLALRLDLACLEGTGGLQPLGIVNAPGINTISIDAVPDFDDLNDMLYQVELDNADMGSLAFVFHPRTLNTLRKAKDANGQYYIEPNPSNTPMKGSLLGFPYFTSTQVPINLGGATDESRIFFGNWKDLLVAEWASLELAASDQTSDAFERRQVWLRAIMEVDVAVRHAESFCVCSDVRES